MSIISQPDSYQGILKRIFYMSVITGVVCTFCIAKASPLFKELLDSFNVEANLGPMKNVKALYLLIPLGIALTSRIFRLHDKLQKVFGIRKKFEERYILQPLAKNLNLNLDEQQKCCIANKRTDLMRNVFYPYASFSNPSIDRQLVYTAADHWGWFWSALESSFILLITIIIFLALSAWLYLKITLGVVLLLVLFMFYQWRILIKTAETQVKAIKEDPKRQEKTTSIFQTLCEGE